MAIFKNLVKLTLTAALAYYAVGIAKHYVEMKKAKDQ